jgi:Na+/H+ antiporter NhaD/arsenite permease-like protein
MHEVTQAASEVFRHPWAAGLIFAGTFVLISFRRLSMLPIGRPSAALLGAVLMVAFGVVEPEEAYQLVNWDTICLLLGMMIIAEHLRAAGLFDIFSRLTEKIYSPFGLLVVIGVVAALSSAVLVNDPVCVVMTPLVLEICRRKKLKPLPYLIMLATSSNIGSSLTLTGNPQNMIIGSLSKLGFLRFVLLMSAPFCAAMLVNIGLAWLFYRNHLEPDAGLPVRPTDAIPRESRPEGIIKTRRLRIGLIGLGLTCAGFVSGFSMAFSALAGAVIVITFHRKDPSELLEKMEWSLLMFFAALFVVIGGLQTSGLARAITEWSLHLIAGDLETQVWIFSGVTLVGSNLLSNVPFVLLASQSIPQMATPELFWCLLAFVSTIAGNLTIFGSVANMIVAETARNDCSISFWAFARFGIPSTIFSLLAGIWLLSHILTMSL